MPLMSDKNCYLMFFSFMLLRFYPQHTYKESNFEGVEKCDNSNKHTRTHSTDLGHTYASKHALYFSGVILCNKYM